MHRFFKLTYALQNCIKKEQGVSEGPLPDKISVSTQGLRIKNIRFQINNLVAKETSRDNERVSGRIYSAHYAYTLTLENVPERSLFKVSDMTGKVNGDVSDIRKSHDYCWAVNFLMLGGT